MWSRKDAHLLLNSGIRDGTCFCIAIFGSNGFGDGDARVWLDGLKDRTPSNFNSLIEFGRASPDLDLLRDLAADSGFAPSEQSYASMANIMRFVSETNQPVIIIKGVFHYVGNRQLFVPRGVLIMTPSSMMPSPGGTLPAGRLVYLVDRHYTGMQGLWREDQLLLSMAIKEGLLLIPVLLSNPVHDSAPIDAHNNSPEHPLQLPAPDDVDWDTAWLCPNTTTVRISTTASTASPAPRHALLRSS